MNRIFIPGRNIDLRPLNESDLQGPYLTWFNDSEVTYYMVKGAFPNNEPQQRRYFNEVVLSSDNLVLAIEAKESGKHIGNVGLHNLHLIHRTAELGIIIGEKEYWGKGMATEAIARICNHGFLQLNLHRIELGVFAEHASAIRCYQKIGFKQEGIKRGHVFKHGTYKDVAIMGILMDELNISLTE